MVGTRAHTSLVNTLFIYTKYNIAVCFFSLVLLCLSIHFISQDFLEKHARISYSQKGEIILGIDSNDQSNKPGNLMTLFFGPVPDGARADSGNINHLSLLNQLLPSL